jgi:hypothetical protein
MAMPEQAAVEAFVDRYRTTFESFDAAAIAACFAFPCQVTSDGDSVTVTSVPNEEAWRPGIERIVGAYRLLGVRSATAAALRVLDVTPHVAHAVVHWVLADTDGATVYDFHASYALADFGEGLRITGIVHDEAPRLLAALARRQAAG